MASSDNLLLYILPDLAYIAKLVPAKKEHDFNISEFRQINGEFLDDNILLEKNLDKLLAKLEKGSYRLILPDFLFTSTIVNIEAKTQEEVKNYLKNQLLPSLHLDEENFYLDTTILSNYKGTFKVQLTALEKALLTPLNKLLQDKEELKLVSISPLSWTSKAVVSLEPSVAILQLGGYLYLAQHYIGVDQCYHTTLAEAANFAETIKTLKGAEPSLQTVYLLTNSLVDDQLQKALKDTLPVQQLADLASENEKMPSYIKQILEAAAKTFSIPEYLLPQFQLDRNYDKQLETAAEEAGTEENEVEAEEEEQVATDQVDADLLEDLVKPVVVGAAAVTLPKPEALAVTTSSELEAKTEEITTTSEGTVKTSSEIEVKEEVTRDFRDKSEDKEEAEEEVIKADSKEENKAVDKDEVEEIDLSQFANLAVEPKTVESKQPDIKVDKNIKETDKTVSANQSATPVSSIPSSKPVIKNQSEASHVAKMILIGLLSFVLTVAVGVGLGVVYLRLTQPSSDQATLSPTPSVSPTEVPTPTPTITVDKSAYSLLVVNATGRAGYAGSIASKIEDGGFPTVAAANARGDYEAQDYLLVSTDDAQAQALLKELETASGLTLQLSSEITKEDSAGNYDAVLVLGR